MNKRVFAIMLAAASLQFFSITRVQGQAMKEMATGLQNVKLYVGADGFEVRTATDGRTIAYGHCQTGNELPPAMLWWLGEYDREIEFAKEQGLTVGNGQWAERNGRTKSAGDTVAPMIDSRWRQYIGYNNMCPEDTSLANLGGHPTTGCVATAMAQIMRYWHFPQHGMGSMSYTHEGEYECWRYGVQSADFANTQYDWDNMPQVLTDSSTEEQIAAVATLCYQCGVSVRMMYNTDCSGSSGAYSAHASTAFTNTFHYKPNYCLNRNSYSLNQWQTILKNEMDNGRPVLYGGQSIEDTARGIGGGGHAFIADGYDTNGYFHINWGWGGWYDGYFAISLLNPAERYEFIYGQQAVVGVEPEHNALAVPMLVQGIDLDGEDFQMGGNVQGSYAVANIGDTVYDGYIGVNVYSPETYDFYGWLDATEVHIQPGDTVFRTFDNPGMTRPVGIYYALGQYNATPLYVTDQVDNALACFSNGQAYFKSVDTNRTELRNVTVCVSFADEDEWLSRTPSSLRSDIETEGGDSFSLHNYVYATTDQHTHLRTVMANGEWHDTIITHIDPNPRCHYQPWSSDNIAGYVCGSNRTMRVNELIGNIMATLNETGIIDYDRVIDGDGDGYIDLLTIIFKDSTAIFEIGDKPETGFYNGNAHLNYRNVGNYTIVNENADVSAHCYGALRMLGLPDMSHRLAWTHVNPLGEWDMMDRPNRQQPSYILKHKYLNIGNEPTELTESGWYTLGDGTLCYKIPFRKDVNSSFLLEMRDQSNFFDQGVPASGLTVARWNDTGDNAEFDNISVPHRLWMMRPGSENDTVQGDLDLAAVNELRTYWTGDSSYFTIDSVSMTESQANNTVTFKLTFFSIEPEPEPEPEPDPNGIDNASGFAVAIYPNPTKDLVYIKSDAILVVEVLSVTGQTMMKVQSQSIDLSSLTPGIYMLRITTTHGTKVKKVMLTER